jgi:hypothetical protein
MLKSSMALPVALRSFCFNFDFSVSLLICRTMISPYGREQYYDLLRN